MSAAAPHPAAELAALPGFPPSPISPPSPVSEVTEVQAAHGSAPALVQQPAAPAIHYVYPPPPPPPLGPIEPDLNAHDRPLRTSKLYVRIVTAVCVAISLILLLALGKQRSGRDPECVRHGSYCYDDYYDYHDGYDMISLPIVRITPKFQNKMDIALTLQLVGICHGLERRRVHHLLRQQAWNTSGSPGRNGSPFMDAPFDHRRWEPDQLGLFV
jgi:hypothetical protein